MDAPTARFEITADDLVEALMVGTRAARARVRWRYAAYGAVAGALALFFHRSAGLDSFYLALLSVLFLALAAARPWVVRRQYAAHVGRRQDIGRTMTVRVADGWLASETDGLGTTTQRLATLHDVETPPGGILIQPFPNEYQWIPARAFPSDAARAAFERALLAGAPLPDGGL